jgi:hypothetical protein
LQEEDRIISEEVVSLKAKMKANKVEKVRDCKILPIPQPGAHPILLTQASYPRWMPVCTSPH